MKLELFAATLSSLTVAQWGIAIILVAAVVAIVMVVLRQMGVTPPAFIIQIMWILLAVVVGIMAIKFVMSIW